MSTETSSSAEFRASSESSRVRPRRQTEYLAWRPPVSAHVDDHTNDFRAPPPNATSNSATGAAGTMSSAAAAASTSERSKEPPRLDPCFLPNGNMSLSGISIRAFVLGIVLGTSSITTIFLLLLHPSPLWRIPFFISSLSLFHFLEFWVTAQYNTRYADVSSFLLTSNGIAYNVAHGSAIIECFVSHYYWFAPASGGGAQWSESVLFRRFSTVCLCAGIVCMLVGQITRTLAMATAGSNFNHIVQVRRQAGHVLVTDGIYSILRHPSYFGFFWWGLGSQLVLQNTVCLVGYALVLWQFFNSRIYREERFLIAFFGDEYISYKSRTIVGIPFIS